MAFRRNVILNLLKELGTEEKRAERTLEGKKQETLVSFHALALAL